MLGLEKGQTLLSRFSLMEALGEGGMGQVWLVRDLELQVHVAVKVLNPQLAARPAIVEMLKNECRNTRRLVHPNIVRIFDFHRSDEWVFISMEYIEGEDLDAYRRRLGILSHNDAIRRLLPVVAALSYAHGMGLVHRDVKGSNVLQMDAPVTWGNSGGPVMNEAGEVVGMATFISLHEGQQAIQGFNFAVPVNVVKEFVRASGSDTSPSLFDEVWDEALGIYYEHKRDAAIQKFDEVLRLSANSSRRFCDAVAQLVERKMLGFDSMLFDDPL